MVGWRGVGDDILKVRVLISAQFLLLFNPVKQSCGDCEARNNVGTSAQLNGPT